MSGVGTRKAGVSNLVRRDGTPPSRRILIHGSAAGPLGLAVITLLVFVHT